MKADAVLSSDDVSGVMMSRSAQMLKRVGGDEIEVPRGGDPYEQGEAWVTRQGKLPVEGVIHVAVFDADGHTDGQAITRSTYNALEQLEKYQWKSIGWPALGTGRSGFSLAESLRAMRLGIHMYAASNPTGEVIHLVFVQARPEERQAFQETYRALQAEGTPKLPEAEPEGQAQVCYDARTGAEEARAPVDAEPSVAEALPSANNEDGGGVDVTTES